MRFFEFIISLEEAVFKTSNQAAIRHEIKGRRVIMKGAYADVPLRDLDQFEVLGTPSEPMSNQRESSS